jgi:multiple sugar transport system permease protein
MSRLASAPMPLLALQPRRLRLDRLPYMLILPSLLVEAMFVYFPILRGIGFSLEGKSGLSFATYGRMLEDPGFWRMILTTIQFALLVDSAVLLVGLAVALLMNRNFAGRGFVRSVLTIPWAMPEVPVAVAFVFMLDPSFGVANRFAHLLPWVGDNPQWLADPDLAMACVVAASVWKTFPFHALIILSALQGISDDLYDAVRIDGGNAWAQFRHVTIPAIRATLALLAVLAFIYSMQQFTLIWLMTGGGPVDATTTVSIGIYVQAFRYYDYSYAGAVSVAGFLMAALATFGFVAAQRRLAVN